MDHHPPQQQQNPIPPPPMTTTTSTTAAAVAATPSPSQFEPKPPPPQPQSPLPQPQPPSTSILNPNPNPRPALLPPGRPPIALPRPSSSVPSTAPRGVGGVALGVPAHRPSPQAPPQAGSFSPAYGHFGGLARSGVGLTELSPSSSASQSRPSITGIPGIGMLGSQSSSVQMRAGGIPAHLQPRPVQSSLRPVPSPANQLSSSQNFQGHGVLRMPSTGTPSTTSPSTPQSVQSLNQPWLASGPQGKPPLPTPSFRQPLPPQSLHPRPQPLIQPQPPIQPQPQPQPQVQSQTPKPPQLQQHTLSLPLTPQPQPMPSSQPQLQLTPEHHGKQVLPPPPRVTQAIPHQQQITRIQGLSNQKPSTPAIVQPNTAQPVPQNRILTAAATTEMDESCGRILSKRSIHELVSQVGPSEKLDPEVEEILMDIADDFVESITTFGCSLAKHRKSTTLEAKDILLHLERNWNITLPGFAGDEIKSFRKPLVNDVHKERLAAIKKSVYATETTTTRNPGGQATGNAKGVVKTPANVFGSPNVKI